MNRVVITGMGVVSPVGLTVDTFWDSVINGKCGVDFIKSFDASTLKVQLAAELKGFDPTNFGIEKSAARKMDLFVQYALAAASQAVAQSGIKSGENIPAERLGVYIGSGIGGIQTFTEAANTCKTRGPERISPHFIPMLIANMATGHTPPSPSTAPKARACRWSPPAPRPTTPSAKRFTRDQGTDMPTRFWPAAPKHSHLPAGNGRVYQL